MPHLLLWRHAEAEEGSDDLARALTPKGHEQARRVAAWLKRFAPEPLRALASPARRSQETLQAFTDRFEILEALAPDSTYQQVLALISWPKPQENLLLVGHQPWIGELAAYILCQAALPCSIPRAALWWLRIDPKRANPVQLRSVIHPKMAD